MKVRSNAKPQWTCKQCGTVFRRTAPNSPSKQAKCEKCLYCSKACYFNAVREGKQRFMGEEKPRVAKVQCDSFTSWAYEWDSQRPPAHHIRKCDHCNKEFCKGSHGRRRVRFCSQRCAKSHRFATQCKCGQVVESPVGRTPLCSSCQPKAKKAYRRTPTYRLHRRMRKNYRKRCLLYGGLFNPQVKPLDVFARDAYRCHVCKKKCAATYRSDNPLSPTIDHHPVPLSKGGDHDWHNVRCACAGCNAKKSNKWDRQLRIKI